MSLFGGLGGFVFAADQSGIKTIFINDNDPAAVATLEANFPDIRISSDDIRELNPGEFQELDRDVDILSAGFPCQSFSQAGENLGFDDERGRLFFEIPRIASEMNKPPKVIVLENVAFLKIFDKGSRLQVVMNELRKAGYWVSERTAQILDVREHTSSPQERERLFIVAAHSNYFRRNKFEFPIKNGEHLHDLWQYIDRQNKGPEHTYLPEENKYERMIRTKAREKGDDRLFQIRRVAVRAKAPNVCPTLTANMGGGGHNVPFLIDEWGVRKLTVDECLKLQGFSRGAGSKMKFPDGIAEHSKYTMIGNAVCVDVASLVFENVKKMIKDNII